MKKHFTLLIFSFLAFHCQSQIDPTADAEFQSLLELYHNAYNAEGISVAVKTEDAIWASAIGNSSVTEELDTEHTFGMGSVSKTITSAVILRMMEDDLLELDDPINLYLDSFPNINQSITIRQLLNHTSGTFNYTDDPSFFEDSFNDPTATPSIESVLNSYVHAPNFSPGASWSYSNTNYLLLGLIIEAVSGQTYHEEVRDQFDLTNNYPSFSLPPHESSTDDLAHLWMDTTGTGDKIDFHDAGLSLTSIFSGAWAAGAYAANPSDIATWAHDLYSGDVLSSDAMTELFTIIPPAPGYGLGVIQAGLPCGQPIVGHSGGIFYTTSTFYDSENNISVSVHCNDATTSDVVGNLMGEIICLYDEFLATSTSAEDIEATLANTKVFPNPFSDVLTIQYELTEKSDVEILLFNELGQEMERRIFRSQVSGDYSIDFSQNIPVGVYFLKMKFGEKIITEKVVKL